VSELCLNIRIYGERAPSARHFADAVYGNRVSFERLDRPMATMPDVGIPSLRPPDFGCCPDFDLRWVLVGPRPGVHPVPVLRETHIIDRSDSRECIVGGGLAEVEGKDRLIRRIPCIRSVSIAQ